MTDSARVPTTPITGVYGGLLKMVMKKMVGGVPESAGVMWNNPRVFKDMMGIGRKAEKWSELDPGLGSLAGMAAAAEIGCSACLDLGYFLAHDKGLDEAKAREVPRWRTSEAFTPLERRVTEYAVAMCRLPVGVTDEMSAALLADLGAPALLELTARVGFMNMSARSNIALGIRSQEFAAACGLEPRASPDAAAPA
ncbi:carboxymuconolactone decarboxylase family protein [Nocardioides guangzhouensis]|uniref:Carboxymuconolactone decarboxylase family protein n=2 Tax=Nocardioides guangzhouensis TaxID=2497878 RepID=A0A4Q4ZFX1_9ACTN|nr:carboxymuconolactone decarboxylase family protein [Nocardioides guangzhouensis]